MFCLLSLGTLSHVGYSVGYSYSNVWMTFTVSCRLYLLATYCGTLFFLDSFIFDCTSIPQKRFTLNTSNIWWNPRPLIETFWCEYIKEYVCIDLLETIIPFSLVCSLWLVKKNRKCSKLDLNVKSSTARSTLLHGLLDRENRRKRMAKTFRTAVGCRRLFIHAKSRREGGGGANSYLSSIAII